jgi:hypothetical protein
MPKSQGLTAIWAGLLDEADVKSEFATYLLRVSAEKPLKYKAFPRFRVQEFHRANLRL